MFDFTVLRNELNDAEINQAMRIWTLPVIYRVSSFKTETMKTNLSPIAQRHKAPEVSAPINTPPKKLSSLVFTDSICYSMGSRRIYHPFYDCGTVYACP